MNTKNKPLFSEFGPVTKENWIEKVKVDLKGADFDKTLVWKNFSKIEIQPFYNDEDKIEFLQNTGENAQSLLNYRHIEVTSEAAGNRLALKAIEEGMNGLLFSFSDEVSPAKLLKGIDLNQIAVSFVLNKNVIEFAKNFIDFVQKSGVSFANVKGYFNTEIISHYVTTGKIEAQSFDASAELIKLTKDFPNFKTVTISGTEYLDSGANQVQEVAYTLNSLVYLIDELAERGIEVQSIFDNLNFNLAIGLEYFVEIGKFRAFNNLLSEIANKYGIGVFSHTISAKTSIWSKSVTDAHTNMLRATTEAMSAILGNVDGVLIDPYDKEFKAPSDFSSRIAGNITTILREESYFGKVANPVDGSFYIEEVTGKIAEKALELFKFIEENGGFYAAFESELIQQQIAEIRLQKLKLISQRRLPMVGINKYPNLMESISANILNGKTETENTKVLQPRRASLEIEAIRKRTEDLIEKTGIRPVVELISYGNLTMRKARAGFAYDFLGVSGFNVLQEKSFDNFESGAIAAAKSDAHVVVICSSDQDYDETALEFVKNFRKLNKEKILLLAGAPTNLEELSQAGLNGCINLRSDVIVTLSDIQKEIQKIVKA
ncbi:methylmalonyl-CoA mutase family protein [Namhaeicola litoreus]|uniref:Methylmalonyl-CoA mutase family protein n=1 Tax=Namhaeicola litoreus TaxID=1052145 RepID=A0ABW3XZW4_9FLAO